MTHMNEIYERLLKIIKSLKFNDAVDIQSS